MLIFLRRKGTALVRSQYIKRRPVCSRPQTHKGENVKISMTLASTRVNTVRKRQRWRFFLENPQRGDGGRMRMCGDVCLFVGCVDKTNSPHLQRFIESLFDLTAVLWPSALSLNVFWWVDITFRRVIVGWRVTLQYVSIALFLSLLAQ